MAAKAGNKGTSRGPQRFALVLFGVLFAGLFIVYAVAEGLGKPSVPSDDVAVVSDVPSEIGQISKEEYGRAIVRQVAEQGLKKTPKEGSTKFEEVKTAALGELIDTVWLTGEAEEQGIEVTPKQVETELETIKEQQFPTAKAYEEFLEQSKFTQEDVDKRVKLRILTTKIQEKITNSVAPPTKSEIADYYESAKAEQFTTKPSRDIRIVVNKDKARAELALKELEKDNSPANWKKVAQQYSEDPTTRANGGEQKALTEELLATAGPLKGAIFGETATGELKGPIKFQGNYSVIEVTKLNAEKVQPLKEVRAQISQTLTQQLQEAVFEEFVRNYQSKWESRTICASGYEVERCSNYKGKPVADPRCYESDPKLKKGETLSCQAPVVQTQPAIPGSVKQLKPQGERKPQRPRHAGEEEAAAGLEGLPEGLEQIPSE